MSAGGVHLGSEAGSTLIALTDQVPRQMDTAQDTVRAIEGDLKRSEQVIKA